MVDKNLEGVKTPEETSKPTPEKEKAKVASKETKAPTLGISQEEFQKAQASWDRQITLAKAEAEKIKAKASAEVEELRGNLEDKQAELADVLREQEELVRQQEDPEIVKAYKSRVSMAAKERELARKEAKLARQIDQAREDANEARKAFRATEIMKEYGCPLEVIQRSDNEYQMELEALKWKMTQGVKTETEEGLTETPLQKFNSGVSTGSSAPSFQDVEKGFAEGKVPYAEYAEARKQAKID